MQTPHLVVLLEAARPYEPSSRHSLADLDELIVERGSERHWQRTVVDDRRRLSLFLPDPRVSGTHARLIRVAQRWVLEDLDSKNGCFVNGVRQQRAVLTDGDVVELGHVFCLYREAPLYPDPDVADAEAVDLLDTPGFATFHCRLGRQLDNLAQVSRSIVPVVIAGESGTGKELAARAIHRLSLRRGAFVAVNCGAIPESLLEAELFGYRKGAFSGAAEDRMGLLRSAHQGTLFLDEIADLKMSVQAALLRALQERQVLAVGTSQPVATDFRVVSAAQHPLRTLVERGVLRADLHARLSGFTIELPPVRDRRSDLGILVAALLRRHAPERTRTLTRDAIRALLRHPWPLNVRELEQCLQTALVLAKHGPISAEHLVQLTRTAGAEPCDPADASMAPSGEELSDDDEALRARLAALLAEHDGNVSAVARAMGKARMQIQRWNRRFGLDPRSFVRSRR